MLYYPPRAGITNIQMIKWMPNLSSFNQHPRFLDIACSIMDTAKTQEMFFDDPVNLSADGLDSVAAVSNPHLMARATRRIAVFYPPDFTGNPFVECADVPYLARDVADGPGRGREAAVCQIARTVAAWQPGLPVDISLVPIRALGTMGPGRVLGTGQFDSLGFSLERNLDLHANFLTLLDLCRGGLSSHVKKCQLSFRLGFYAYHEAEEARALLPIFIAFATIPTFRQLRLPSHPSYTPSDGVTPVPVRIAEIARTAAVPLTSSPTWHSEKQGPSERYKTYVTRVTTIYESKLRRYSGEFAQAFLAQTDRPPNIPRAAPWFNMGQCVASVQSYYASCRHNVVLRAFTEQTIQVLDQYRVQTPPFVREYMFGTNLAHDPPCLASAVSFSALLDQRSPPIPRTPLRSFQGQAVEYDRPADTENLRAILSEFTSSSDVLHQRYGSDLEKSRKDLDGGMVPIVPTEHAPAEDVDRHLDQAKGQMVIYFNLIRSALQPSEDSSAEIAMERAGLWPSLTRRTVLERLSHTLIDGLPRGWQRSIVAFALRLLEFQRSSRLLGLALKGNPEEFAKEANNKVTDVEASPEHPDWLLIQIDGDFLARKLQLDVAREMISPSTGANMALQLNMGEGKSSVIVPLVSAALADGDQLARIVVLKALTVQMFHLLVDRLCGLAGRRIFYLPFSRNVHLSTDNVSKVQDLYTQCVQEKGVMIAQPEHLLSYRLKGMDVRLHRSANGDVVIADKLAESQQWLSQHARDILDESDEILHVRNQLNYTVGTQRPIEDHPDRWTTTQQVFGVVARIFAAIQTLYPSQVELRDHCRSRFPSIRVLGPDAARSLVEKVATQAFAGNIPNLALALLHGPTKQAAYNFIISSVIDENDYSHLKSHLADSSSLWKGLLLLRGLLGNGILDHVLSQRRYRVDYGLDPRRTMLAVPYRAKDVPSLRSEFGHQDVGICLTILSYYYEGITSAQLHQCFGLLHKQDNPSLEYENWVKKVDGLPVALRQLTGVNTRDVDQFNDVLFPHLGRCHAVVDFFLSQVVFPKEAKEFPEKLSSSPWDLIDLTERVTTGFSGTNDNRYLLPTSIEQCDPVNQLSTNARVLMYLLQPENGNYICTQNAGEGPRSVDSFLQLLVEQDPQPRVLLDVGAQMLDKQNKDLVWDWLLLMPNVDAAIFFTDSDELTVLARDGTVEPFISSPFNQQLDRCIIYLDDAHTRGTDLKLPRDYHAAVTLGPKVTKDRLLQGCMRMRKLGHGQSVMFCAPAEVDTRILEARTNANPAAAVGPVAVLDIIRWAMLVSIDDVKRNVPQWAQQGMDQARRHTALAIYSNPGANSQPASEAEKIEMLKGAWLQPEARTLEVLYGRRHGTEQSLYQLAQTFPLIAARLELIGVTSLSDSRMEEEQEREVSHEMERERQIERPPYTREFEGLGQPQSDGFIKPEHRRGILTESCKFDVSPLALLKELFGLRRKGTGFASTHMGKILHARLLQDDDFT
ncbi:hypothetical protein OF83DRAFT_1168575 [Amylostereum chailletii]|nr:hypothetical protein OF83DRAFT_1168575 [Amylostereum chailletii]